MAKLLNMYNLNDNISKVYYFFFPKIFSLLPLHTCLNIILVFYKTEHTNLPIHSTEKFTHLGHFANSSVCCRFLRFSQSNLAFMIRKMLGIIRRISLTALNEFRCFCDSKIFDVVEVLLWRIIASFNFGSRHMSSRNITRNTIPTSFSCSTRTNGNVAKMEAKIQLAGFDVAKQLRRNSIMRQPISSFKTGTNCTKRARKLYDRGVSHSCDGRSCEEYSKPMKQTNTSPSDSILRILR